MLSSPPWSADTSACIDLTRTLTTAGRTWSTTSAKLSGSTPWTWTASASAGELRKRSSELPTTPPPKTSASAVPPRISERNVRFFWLGEETWSFIAFSVLFGILLTGADPANLGAALMVNMGGARLRATVGPVKFR
jgi:hypothetical protein